MTKRDATATLAGFQFQFLKTLEEILNSNDLETTTIEGVLEDIDVSDSLLSEEIKKSIQCKYHGFTKAKFTPSDIKLTLAKMFVGHQANPNIQYYLYIYHIDWGIHDPNSSIEFVSKCLGFRDGSTSATIKINDSEDVTINRDDLPDFCTHLTVEKAEEISVYENKLCEQLSLTLRQKKEIIKSYQFPNAISCIFEKAAEKDINKRKTTKEEFLKEINKSEELFSYWYTLYLSQEELISFHEKTSKRLNLNKKTTARAVYIESNGTSTQKPQIGQIKYFIESVTKASYVSNIREQDKPIVFILNLLPEEIKNIKEHLISQELFFNDGYESILFSEKFFINPLFFTKKEPLQIAKRVSFNLKIISIENYDPDLCNFEVIYKYLYNLIGEEQRPQKELKAAHILDLSDIGEIANIQKIVQE